MQNEELKLEKEEKEACIEEKSAFTDTSEEASASTQDTAPIENCSSFSSDFSGEEKEVSLEAKEEKTVLETEEEAMSALQSEEREEEILETEKEEREKEDYCARAEEDMRAILLLFPELSPDGEELTLGGLRNPRRFAELRESGLSVEEAFLASNYRMLSERPRTIIEERGDKKHLRPALPRSQGRGESMPASLLLRSRSLFEGLSDSELASLYRRVTK